ncbi:MAG: hypothetical protein II743_01280 [Lachnospiraceae bacterium]|nr:hypothetical protein [Lachnospiraceae bacterium]
MTKQQFAEAMKEKVSERFGDEYQIDVREVTKNNGVVLTGLMVTQKDTNVAPTVYVDASYESFQRGKSLDETAEPIIKSLERAFPKSKIDMEFFTDYEKVKDLVCFRLVNAESNKEALEGQPHVPFMDMAVQFFVPFHNEEIGSGSITIRNEHAERWGVTAGELMEAAKVNTPRLFPPRCMRMDLLLMEMAGGTGAAEEVPTERFDESPFSMHVLTNSEKVYGAGILLYDGYLQRVAEAGGSDLHVICSSVHEVLILPKGGEEEAERLREIVREVNATQVDAQDKLSDNLYSYNAATHELGIAEGKAQAMGEDQGPVICM